jgi:bifunctional UDP-N-acetylglucosamine pyrophosphorylase/glucosamine-1-phosphate N-acetyltransferase
MGAAAVHGMPMQKRTWLPIVLAAGEGTRMRARLPKVLHEVGRLPLLGHVLAAVRAAGAADAAVVVGPGHEAVSLVAQRLMPEAQVFVQTERRGTAHAVLSARQAIARGFDDIVVAFGDTPLIRPETLTRVRKPLADGAAVVVLGFRPRDPSGYGRLLTRGHDLVAVREEKDATPAERAIGFCNAGLMALSGRHALAILDRIGDANAKREFYLTDAVEIARTMGHKVTAIEAEEGEVRGINTKAQLAEAEAELQQRLRAAALEAGVTMVAPETVYLAADTKLGVGVEIEPFVVFGPGVVVEDGAVIRSFSRLEMAHIGPAATVGPFARLRPGARIGAGAHIGNFVEIKEAVVEAGAKANHFAYIGDARVGEGANIGAGTIFCNYDGKNKHRTDIGKGAFIGSNSSLVAPVSIGDHAYVGSGSVITRDVPAGALALGRARQVVKEGWATLLRSLPPKRKKAPATD